MLDLVNGRRTRGQRWLASLWCCVLFLAITSTNSPAWPAARFFGGVAASKDFNGSSTLSLDPFSLRASADVVASDGDYNYAPTVMLDGNYRVWWWRRFHSLSSPQSLA